MYRRHPLVATKTPDERYFSDAVVLFTLVFVFVRASADAYPHPHTDLHVDTIVDTTTDIDMHVRVHKCVYIYIEAGKQNSKSDRADSSMRSRKEKNK